MATARGRTEGSEASAPRQQLRVLMARTGEREYGEAGGEDGPDQPGRKQRVRRVASTTCVPPKSPQSNATTIAGSMIESLRPRQRPGRSNFRVDRLGRLGLPSRMGLREPRRTRTSTASKVARRSLCPRAAWRDRSVARTRLMRSACP